METTGPVLTSNLFLDRFGEVVLALDSDGLTWEPVESQELSTSCLGFTFNTKTETQIKYSDIYAVESINWGLIHKLIPNTGGLLSDGHCEMYRFVVHGFWRSRSQQSVWVLAEYTFGHKDLCTCQMLVNHINDHISKDVARPKSLLVFVHPLSGKKTGRKTWESVKPIFSRANVKTKVIVTENAGHARDFIKSITDCELNSFDGVLAVGGDGFFNEILNGLLASRHSAGYPFSPHEFMHSVGKNDRNVRFETNKSSNIEKNDDDLKVEFAASPERDEDEPLLTSSETTMPGFSFIGKEDGSCNTDAGQDFTFSFPNNWFRLGIIPAGSTDSIVLSTTGARDPVTSALHVILGKRTRLDIVQIIPWNSELSSADVHSVRYAASFAGYGFYGDVIKESEKYRWMGPKRYDYAGTMVFLRHRTYEADVVFLEHKKPSTISGRGSEGTCVPQEMVCRVNCVRCNEPQTNPAITPANKRDMNSSLPPEKSTWVTCKGRFHSVGAAVISCRNERAPDGLVANAHLADGYMHLILVKECPLPLYLWHLTQLTRRGAEPLNFEFIEHHQTQAFTFTTSDDESVWNLDGELFHARQLSAQVLRGLVSLFAAGPEV